MISPSTQTSRQTLEKLFSEYQRLLARAAALAQAKKEFANALKTVGGDISTGSYSLSFIVAQAFYFETEILSQRWNSAFQDAIKQLPIADVAGVLTKEKQTSVDRLLAQLKNENPEPDSSDR